MYKLTVVGKIKKIFHFTIVSVEFFEKITYLQPEQMKKSIENYVKSVCCTEQCYTYSRVIKVMDIGAFICTLGSARPTVTLGDSSSINEVLTKLHRTSFLTLAASPR